MVERFIIVSKIMGTQKKDYCVIFERTASGKHRVLLSFKKLCEAYGLVESRMLKVEDHKTEELRQKLITAQHMRKLGFEKMWRIVSLLDVCKLYSHDHKDQIQHLVRAINKLIADQKISLCEYDEQCIAGEVAINRKKDVAAVAPRMSSRKRRNTKKTHVDDESSVVEKRNNKKKSDESSVVEKRSNKTKSDDEPSVVVVEEKNRLPHRKRVEIHAFSDVDDDSSDERQPRRVKRVKHAASGINLFFFLF